MRSRVLIAGAALVVPFGSLACTIASTGMRFGAFNPIEDHAVDSTGSVVITCSPAATYTIELGAGSADGYSPRRMSGPANRGLDYNLYLNASRTVVWGDGSGGTASAAGSDSGGGTSHTIYGRIPAGQNPHVGSYSDSIVITVVY